MMYRTLDYAKNCRVEFGTYVETHKDAPPTNTIAELPQGGIFLGTTTNFQGSCKFLSLRTGRRITIKQFTPLPTPQSVIKQVEYMAIKENREEDFLFTDQNWNTLEVYDDDSPAEDATAGVDYKTTYD